MNRLQTKCFLGAAGVHLLLCLILIIGPAFLSSPSKSDEISVLDLARLGDPDARPPLVRAPLEQQPQREPTRDVVKQEQPVDVITEHRHKVEINKTLVARKPNAGSESTTLEDTRRQSEKREQLAREIRGAAESISREVSGSIRLTLGDRPDGGVPDSDFNQNVMAAYARAWHGTVPNDSTDANVSAEASVTIAKDGSVICSRITRAWGKPGVDHSVQSVLDRVKFAAPLPSDVKEDQRTIAITFEVQPMRD